MSYELDLSELPEQLSELPEQLCQYSFEMRACYAYRNKLDCPLIICDKSE